MREAGFADFLHTVGKGNPFDLAAVERALGDHPDVDISTIQGHSRRNDDFAAGLPVQKCGRIARLKEPEAKAARGHRHE
jgi:hypothetical protein